MHEIMQIFYYYNIMNNNDLYLPTFNVKHRVYQNDLKWVCNLYCVSEQGSSACSVASNKKGIIQFVTTAFFALQYKPPHDKTNKMSVRPVKTDQPGHPPD